jgi:hypothetical protein
MRYSEILQLIEASGIINRKAGDTFVNVSDPDDVITYDGEYKAYPEDKPQFENPAERDAVIKDLKSKYPDFAESNKANNSTLAFATVVFTKKDKKSKKMFVRYFRDTNVALTPGRWENKNIPGYSAGFKSAVKNISSFKPGTLYPPHNKRSAFAVKQVLDHINRELGAEYHDPIAKMMQTKRLPTFTNQPGKEEEIRDYLGESIQPLAFVAEASGIEGQWKDAESLLGGSGFKNCKVFFPAEQNNPLCDSYLIAPNGLEVGISSKGKDGANASIKNLKDTVDKLREIDPANPLLTKYKKTVEVIDYLGSKGVSAIVGPIELAKKEKLITDQQATILYELFKTRSQAQNIEDYPEMQNIYDAYGFKTDPENLRKFRLRYGLLANVAKMVSAHYNDLPEFQEGGIKLLNQSSIVQAYTFTRQDGDDVVVTKINTIYPPNFKGIIQLDGGKNYTGNANQGKIAFKFKKA